MGLAMKFERTSFPRFRPNQHRFANGALEIWRWLEAGDITANPPRDALAAFAMLRPDLFLFENWDVEITKEGHTEGLTLFAKRLKGKLESAPMSSRKRPNRDI